MHLISVWALALGLFALGLTTGGALGQDITVFSGRTMGPIPYQVRAVLPPEVDAQVVQQRITSVLGDVNQQMSTYIDDSELSRFNRSREIDSWIDVSAATAQVVTQALRIAEQTEGAFDPTVGPLVNLWGFGPDKRRPALPAEARIEAERAKTGYAKVSVRLDPPGLRKSIPEVEIDLSAIAKGYAVDAVGAMLGELGCESYMVEIGGEVMAQGRKPGGHHWTIGIESPAVDGSFTAILRLEDGALATSGDYRNYYEIEGRRYSHTIDPTTGKPVEHGMATVSIHASSCMEADALATALMVMGPERGLAFAEENGIAALLVAHQGEGFEELSTSAWQRLAAVDSQSPRDQPATKGTNAMAGEYIWLVAIVAVVFGLAILAMAVGAMVAGKRIKGSCGGIAGLKDEHGNTRCSLCSNPSPDCSREDPAADREEYPSGIPSK